MLPSLESVDLIWKLTHSEKKPSCNWLHKLRLLARKQGGWATDTVQHGLLWPGGLDLSNPHSNHPVTTLSCMGITSQLLALHLRGLCDPRAVRCCKLFRDRQWDNGFGSGTHLKLEAVRVKPGIMEARTLELCVAAYTLREHAWPADEA